MQILIMASISSTETVMLPVLKNELTTETKFLVTSKNVFEMEWDALEGFLKDIENLKIPVKLVSGIQEWGQDFIKLITLLNDNEIRLNIVLRVQESLIIKSIKEKLGCKIFLENVSRNSNLYNLQKGGNYCVLPNKVKLNGYDKNIVKLSHDVSSDFAIKSNYLCLKIYDPNFRVDDYYGEKVFHLDEIFTIIPTGYGEEDYIIFLYNPICPRDIGFEKSLKEIFEYNYTVLKKAFGEKKIYLFDLEFTKGSVFNTSYIVSPPLFNRLLIRKNNHFYIYFPEQKYNNMVKLKGVMNQIISIFPHISYYFINTQTLHNLGGNIHCAFKVI